MAAPAGSQNRCVFVGNIPYDATEEQLIQICEEVGPVVSFRLVIDRETGKPKGYGFCEYKDEETALSARRNLQGYDINGRQLRVDFAENDKNADRNREQGRGGPGFATNADSSKHPSGLPISTDPIMLHQPMGLQIAAPAALLMAGALGGAQIATAQSRLQNHPGGANDPLSAYLSRFSRHQLHEILSEMKALTTTNKTLALQLLQGSPQLSKALFQVLTMLGLVTPHMLQMVSQQASSSTLHLPSNSAQAVLQKEALIGLPSRPPLSQVPVISQNPGTLQQSGQHIHGQHPQFLHSQGLQATFAGKSGTSIFPPASHQSVPIQPASLPASKGLISQNQPAFLQQPPASTLYANLHHKPQPNHPNTTLQQPILPRPRISQTNLSNGLPLPISSEMLPKEVSTSSMGQDSTWLSRTTSQDSAAASADPQRAQLVGHPSKFRRLEDGSHQTYAAHATSKSQVVAPDTMQQPEKHVAQLSPEVEAALLQQVLSLTSEQLNSLTAEQQQQVLQIQKMLSASK